MCPCSLGTWVSAQGDTYQVVADVSQFEPPDIVVTTSNCHVAIQAEKVRHPGEQHPPRNPIPGPWSGWGPAPWHPSSGGAGTRNGPCWHWGSWELSPGDRTTRSSCSTALLLHWVTRDLPLPALV